MQQRESYRRYSLHYATVMLLVILFILDLLHLADFYGDYLEKLTGALSYRLRDA